MLNISPLDEIYTINLAYRQIIDRYNYNNLSENDIKDIKLLKKAKYILTNPNLKYKYDYLLYKATHIDGPNKSNQFDGPNKSNQFDGPNKSNDESTRINNKTKVNNLESSNLSVPLPENDNDYNNYFDNVFNVDNKWMKNNEHINNVNVKQDNKLDNNLINGRIFDLSEIYNRQITYEDIPKIQNTRDDKTE